MHLHPTACKVTNTEEEKRRGGEEGGEKEGEEGERKELVGSTELQLNRRGEFWGHLHSGVTMQVTTVKCISAYF